MTQPLPLLPVTLMRERLTDAAGTALIEADGDPASWLDDDTLDAAETGVETLGAAMLQVIGWEVDPELIVMTAGATGGACLRCRLEPAPGGQSLDVALGHLVVLQLDAATLVYVVVLSGSDCDAGGVAIPAADSLIALGAGEALLALREDLSEIGDPAQAARLIEGAGGADAQH